MFGASHARVLALAVPWALTGNTEDLVPDTSLLRPAQEVLLQAGSAGGEKLRSSPASPSPAVLPLGATSSVTRPGRRARLAPCRACRAAAGGGGILGMGSSAAGATGCEFRFAGSRVFPALARVPPGIVGRSVPAVAGDRRCPAWHGAPKAVHLNSGAAIPPGAAPRDLEVLQGIQDGMSRWPRQAEQHPQDIKVLQWLGGLWGQCGRALGAVQVWVGALASGVL